MIISLFQYYLLKGVDMIDNFFNVVQQDIAFLANYSEQSNESDDQQQKVSIVAMRMFAVVGMAFSVILGLRSFAAHTAMGGIFKLASAVALYTLSHDIFVMGVNSEKNPLDQFLSIGKGLWNDAKDLWQGHKNLDDVPRHPLSEGTFYRPMWDIVLSQE